VEYGRKYKKRTKGGEKGLGSARGVGGGKKGWWKLTKDGIDTGLTNTSPQGEGAGKEKSVILT